MYRNDRPRRKWAKTDRSTGHQPPGTGRFFTLQLHLIEYFTTNQPFYQPPAWNCFENLGENKGKNFNLVWPSNLFTQHDPEDIMFDKFIISWRVKKYQNTPFFPFRVTKKYPKKFLKVPAFSTYIFYATGKKE